MSLRGAPSTTYGKHTSRGHSEQQEQPKPSTAFSLKNRISSIVQKYPSGSADHTPGTQIISLKPNLAARAQRHQLLRQQYSLNKESSEKLLTLPKIPTHDSMKTRASITSQHASPRASPMAPPRSASLGNNPRLHSSSSSPLTRKTRNLSITDSNQPGALNSARGDAPPKTLIAMIDTIRSNRTPSSASTSTSRNSSFSHSYASSPKVSRNSFLDSDSMKRSLMTPPRNVSSGQRTELSSKLIKISIPRLSEIRGSSGATDRSSSFHTDDIPPPSPNASNIRYMAHAKRKRKLALQDTIPKVTPAKHMTGFTNLGNTCFMNSALQCLLSSELLVSFFFFSQFKHDLNNNSTTKGHLAEAFAGVIDEIYRKNARSVAPKVLKARFEKYAPDFLGYNQQDAQEFLRFLLDGLHEDLNRVKVRPKLLYDEKFEDTLDDLEKANLSWNRYHALNDSFIFDLFGGQLQSTIHCLTCDYQSSTFDTFWDLSLPIPKESETKVRRSAMALNADFKQCTLQDCLKNFAAEEVLDGTEKYNCPRCKKPQKSTKKLRIYKYPEVMVLHIKRFMQTRFGREKLTTGVAYPPILTDFNAIGSELDGHDEMPSYELIAICCHSGGLGGGHYVAHCRSIEDGQWYICNDSHISPSSISGHESSAYMLFYKKINLHD